MIKAIILIIVLLVIALVITLVQPKHPLLAFIVAFLGISGTLFGATKLITKYDPLVALENELKDSEKAKQEASSSSSEETDPPLEVVLPDKNTDEGDKSAPESDNNKQQHITVPVIVNVGEEIHRNENNKIYVAWTPIINQESYSIKVEADDPFADIDTKQEYTCAENDIYIDVSEYEAGTLLFLSVAVLNENSEWVYSDPINSRLF